MYYGMEISTVFGTAMFLVSFLWGDVLAGFFTTDPEVVAAAADYLRSYAVDCAIVGLNFSMMGYFNGNGKTTFVAAQGVLSAFLVRIPVSYFMSKIPGVSLFQIGFATPLATVAAIIMDVVYLIHFEKTKKIS
jgi:Na+-driven multidrug efflux pump